MMSSAGYFHARFLLSAFFFFSDRVRPRFVFRKNLNASKPSEHPPQVEECLKGLGGNIGCRDKTSSWYQKGSPM